MEYCSLLDFKNEIVKLPYYAPTKQFLDQDIKYPDMNIDTYSKDYEFYKRLFDGLDEGKVTMFDIGANMGLYSIYFANFCKKIYAIEPSLTLCNCIKLLTEQFENIKICNNAISNSNKITDFYYFPDYCSMSTLNQINPPKNHVIKYKVKCYTIQEFMKKENLDFLDICKVDVEGEEVNIFNDETLDILKNRVGRYFIEIHNSCHINGKVEAENKQDFKALFSRHGYKIDFHENNGNHFIAKLK